MCEMCEGARPISGVGLPYLDNLVTTAISDFPKSHARSGSRGNLPVKDFEDFEPAKADRLASISKQDRPWDKHKNGSVVLEDAMRARGGKMSRRAERIAACAEQLAFVMRADGGERRLRLHSATFCRVRGCPVCAWRRSLKWLAKMHKAWPLLVGSRPDLVPLMLTLTVPNCEVADLRFILQEMGAAWHRLINRKAFKGAIVGWLRNTEITRGRDGASCHPHYHVLLLVPRSYFKGGTYMTQRQWHDLWRGALRLPDVPDHLQVDVRRIRTSADDPEGMIPKKGMLEVTKYTTKVKDITDDPDWFVRVLLQCESLRFVASGGILKDVLSDKDDAVVDDDLVHIDEDNQEDAADAIEMHEFTFWRGEKKRCYYRTGITKATGIRQVDETHAVYIDGDIGEQVTVSLADRRWAFIDHGEAMREAMRARIVRKKDSGGGDWL